MEELGIEVEVSAGAYAVVEHAYESKLVHLQFIPARLISGEPRPIQCAEVAWVAKEDLRNYEFPAADAGLLEKLLQDELFWNMG